MINFKINFAKFLNNNNNNNNNAEFDIFWRKSAPLRFKQLQNAETSTIFELWPEFCKPSAWQLVMFLN